MEATATTTTKQRQQIVQARVRALVRFNTLTFHSLAVASFLETAVPLQAERLKVVFAGHVDVRLWLEQVWWPQRAGRGQRLREYVETTWPEFDWKAAYEEFYQVYRARAGLDGRSPGIALEALGLCAMAAQAAVLYRALAHCADESALRALAREAACEHVAYFEYFRALFERWKRRDRVGLAAGWRALQAACRSARDLKVEAAFAPLGNYWNGARSTVPELTYDEFRQRMALLIRRHAALGSIERLLFRAWLERGGAAPAPQSPSALPPRVLPLVPRPGVA
jgi:hypothetical protein